MQLANQSYFIINLFHYLLFSSIYISIIFFFMVFTSILFLYGFLFD